MCLGLWILELSKTLMYEFSYDYVKLKYGEKSKLCYMDTDSFIVYKKNWYCDIYKDIAEDVETRFDTYELNRPSPKGQHKKSNSINERWIRGKHHDKFVGLRVKAYTYLRDHSSADKKAKGTKKVFHKKKT